MLPLLPYDVGNNPVAGNRYRNISAPSSISGRYKQQRGIADIESELIGLIVK